jgi:hypothetical protein
MAYLLDANVLISAKNLHYGFDFCPAFWEWLVAQNESHGVFSVEKVGDEVLAVADELSNRAQDGVPLSGCGQQLGERAAVQFSGGQHLLAGGRLLSCGSSPRRNTYHCDARSAVGFDA